jgi:putative ABC transport system substrate-binding protein
LDRLPELAAELAHLKVDVIVARGTRAIRAADQASATIPVVMAYSADAVGDGLVASLARPGGNITGLTAITPDLSAKRLELLKESSPKISRIAVLYNPTDGGATSDWKEIEAAAPGLRVALQPLEIRDPNEFNLAFEAIKRERADALVTFTHTFMVVHRNRVLEFATKSRLPAMYGLRLFVEAGGLMSYSPSVTDMYRSAASYVDKILKGAKPGDLPVQQPTKFELVINLKAAQQIGLTIPPNVLARADRIIK